MTESILRSIDVIDILRGASSPCNSNCVCVCVCVWGVWVYGCVFCPSLIVRGILVNVVLCLHRTNLQHLATFLLYINTFYIYSVLERIHSGNTRELKTLYIHLD